MALRVLIISLLLTSICTLQTNLFAQNDSAEISGVNFYYPKNAYRPIISDDIKSYIDDLKEFMEENKEVNVKLDGYAQDGKNEEWNTRVSKYRVRALRDILIDYGINKRRIEIEYFGKSNFIASDDTLKEVAKNRRVELRIQDTDS